MPTQEKTVLRQIRDLVETPSVSSTDDKWDSSNRPVAELIATFAEAQGFAVDCQPLPGKNGKVNIVARMGPTSADPAVDPLLKRGGLVLSGHTDTVPFDHGKWQSDPLKLTERDGGLYGLGSADMKSFFAIALAAAAQFRASDLKKPLYLLATADEESSMDGARALQAHSISGAEAAIIGEPTSLRPVRMHKGIMMQGIRLTGQSGHSSNPALGNNVIDALPELLGLLDSYRKSLAQRFHCELLAVPAPTLNFGCLHGGDSPNRICGQMDLHFDVRLNPGMDFEQIESELQLTVIELAAKRGIAIEMRRLVEPVPPFEQAAKSELITTSEALSGYTAQVANYTTEAPFLQRLGLETVVMGPGSIDCAHQPNEHLPLAEIKPAIALLTGAIDRYCR